MHRTFLSATVGIAFAFWAGFFALPQASRAQTSAAPSISPLELIMNWSVGTYAPVGYPGKPLPVPQSRLTVSVDAIRNGKLSSLAGQTVRWYANDRLIGSGAGMQTMTFPLGTTAPGTFDVRVELPGIVSDDLTVKTISIPVARPYAAIIAPFPETTVQGARATLHTVPYFFNIDAANDLLYSWTVGGEAPQANENPDELILSVTRSGIVETAAIIRNPRVPQEAAENVANIMFSL